VVCSRNQHRCICGRGSNYLAWSVNSRGVQIYIPLARSTQGKSQRSASATSRQDSLMPGRSEAGFCTPFLLWPAFRTAMTSLLL
jgi:hypothetical protein